MQIFILLLFIVPNNYSTVGLKSFFVLSRLCLNRVTVKSSKNHHPLKLKKYTKTFPTQAVLRTRENSQKTPISHRFSQLAFSPPSPPFADGNLYQQHAHVL